MTSQPPASRRALTDGEVLILEEIQRMYGAQNTEEQVVFSDSDEAVLFVKDRAGTMGLCAVLTNLAHMYGDGTIPNMEELRSKWLAGG